MFANNFNVLRVSTNWQYMFFCVSIGIFGRLDARRSDWNGQLLRLCLRRSGRGRCRGRGRRVGRILPVVKRQQSSQIRMKKQNRGKKILCFRGHPSGFFCQVAGSNRNFQPFVSFFLLLVSFPTFMHLVAWKTFSRLISSQLISSAANAFCSSNFTAFRLTPRVGVTAFHLISFSHTLQM